jgi:branched-chain amino acid transport system substrate-binding protein
MVRQSPTRTSLPGLRLQAVAREAKSISASLEGFGRGLAIDSTSVRISVRSFGWMWRMRCRRLWFGLLVALLCRVGAAEIVVAQVAPLSGPSAAYGSANATGTRAYFDQVNAQGGVNGQRIRFVTVDDQYKPEETIALLKSVGERERPVAFVNLVGSANVAAVLKDQTMEKLRVPVIGVTPGTDSLRNPGSPWLFHVTAGDNAQLARIVRHLSTIGMTRVAVVHQVTPTGKAGLAYVDQLIAQTDVKVVGRVSVPLGADDLKAAAAQIKAIGAQTCIMILTPNSSVAFVRDARQGGDTAPIYGMSYVPVKDLVDKATLRGAVGVGLAQVTPNPSSPVSGLTREFHATLDKYAPQGTDRSQLHLIGYLSARVTVEALRRAGANPTPESMAAALRQLRIDLGGYLIDFQSGGGNVGSRFVEIGVVDGRGKLVY